MFYLSMKNALQIIHLQGIIKLKGDPVGARTQGPLIKSQVLYQLSYGIKLLIKKAFHQRRCKYTKLFKENQKENAVIFKKITCSF